jgi:hypothetical protein
VNIQPLFRSVKFPISSPKQQSQQQESQCDDEQQEEENVDNNDGKYYMWDGDVDDEYFDDCGLEFVAPKDDSIDNIDLTSESAEEALFIATYRHGTILNCVDVKRKKTSHLQRMKKLGATKMFSGSNFTIAHYFVLLFEHRVKYNSGDNEIHNMVLYFAI